MLKLFKLTVQDHLDENDNPVVKVKHVACFNHSDLNKLGENILTSKQLIPFEVIE
jgi:hypothetical protein